MGSVGSSIVGAASQASAGMASCASGVSTSMRASGTRSVDCRVELVGNVAAMGSSRSGVA